MKREETKVIEKVLYNSLFGSNEKLAREYGTKEVTIGFQRNGNGREIVDFMSYEPKEDIIKCYEIKVSMQDFKSGAKKSWCGNYNYLVVSKDLYMQMPLEKWKNEIPLHVGIIVVDTNTLEKRAVKNALFTCCNTDKRLLKDSLIRTLFYQNRKLQSKKGQV